MENITITCELVLKKTLCIFVSGYFEERKKVLYILENIIKNTKAFCWSVLAKLGNKRNVNDLAGKLSYKKETFLKTEIQSDNL